MASVFPFVGGKANGIPRAKFFPDDQQLRSNSRRNDIGEDAIRFLSLKYMYGPYYAVCLF